MTFGTFKVFVSSESTLCTARLVESLSNRLLCLVKRSYLVDPASSHMLVSKIKPCMSKYKRLYSETANGSLYQL